MIKHRVAILTGIPAPYREPVFANLAARPGVDLTVFYCAHGHSNVAWTSASECAGDYRKEFLPNWTPPRRQRLPMVGYSNPAIWKRLREFDPTYMVIYGYNQLTHWLAFSYCRTHKVPFALRSDSNAWIDKSSSWKSRIRRRMVSMLVRRSAAVLPVGSANRAYWESYGAVEQQIHMAPYAIDNQRAASLAGVWQPDAQGRTRFLYVGRLVPRKGVDLLIEAFNRLSADRPVHLTIVGDGSERERLVSLQTPDARAKTDWVGKVSNDLAMEQYGKADVFVLPSRYEPWGLVVNEAMAAGLPVIADIKCGAAIDLIDEGQTGWFLPELSVDGLTESMRRSIADPSRTRAMGEQAREKIQGWSFDRTVDGFVSAFNTTSPAPSASPETLRARSRIGRLLAGSAPSSST